MNKMILKLSTIAVLLFFSMPVNAQEADDSSLVEIPLNNMEIIAEVDIWDAKVVNQKNHNILVDFTLNNGRGAQSDIRYAYELVKNNADKSSEVIYRKVFDDVVNMASGTKIYKKVLIEIPPHIRGTFDLYLIAKNGDGMSLAANRVASVVLESTIERFFNIYESSCVLKIEGSSKNYSIFQGLDVAQGEKLNLVCDVENMSEETIETQVFVDTYRRTIFGNRIETAQMPQKISFAPREKKNIALEIVKPTEPQAYDAIVSIKENGNELSNHVYLHYVVQGEGASISNLQLDKSEYIKGETLTATFLWSLSADNFPDSRTGMVAEELPFYSLTIKDSTGIDCIAPVSHMPATKQIATTKSVNTVISDCLYPQVSLILEDSDNRIITNKDFNFVPKAGNENVGDDALKEDKFTPFKIGNSFKNIITNKYTIVGVIITLLLILLVLLKSKKGVTKVALFLMTCGLLFLANGVDAATVSGSLGGASYECTFNLNSSSYNPSSGANVAVTGCRIVACLNEMNIGVSVAGGGVTWIGHVTDGDGGGVVDTRFSQSGTVNIGFTTPSSCGNKSVGVTVHFNRVTSSGFQSNSAGTNLPYNVVNCIVHGSCGASNGKYFYTPPAADLCNAGIFNNFQNAAFNYWTWTCDGEWGGNTANCKTIKTKASKLRALDGTNVLTFVAEDGTTNSKYRIRAGSELQYIMYVDPSHPKASKVRIKVGPDVKALLIY